MLSLEAFFLSSIQYIFPVSSLSVYLAGSWPQASPFLSPRFLLPLILSACQPCLSLYCLAIGHLAFLLDQLGAFGKQG